MESHTLREFLSNLEEEGYTIPENVPPTCILYTVWEDPFFWQWTYPSIWNPEFRNYRIAMEF